MYFILFFCCFQAEDGTRGFHVTGVQTCALPIYPRPSRTQHYFHYSRRSRTRIQLNDRLPLRFLGEMLRCLLRLETFQSNAATAAGTAARGLAFLVAADAHGAHARQRLRVVGETAVRSNDQDLPEFVGVAHTHFADP